MSADAVPFDYDLLRELTEESGVPGYEDRVREIVVRELDAATDRVETDARGNVVGTVEGDSDYAVVVAAHMDEIGFMVRHVTEEGFLKVDPLGGFDPRVLKAQRVTVHTADGDLPGVIGSPPPHTMDEEDLEAEPKVEDVAIDVGRDPEVVAELVAVGDLVTLSQRTTRVGDLVTGKALDDRVCVFQLIEAARRLEEPAVTVHFAATVQEEVGLRGAQAIGVDRKPDLGLALDVTVANDVPGFEDAEHVTDLGAGAAIKLKDGSVITTPAVVRRLREVAEYRDVPTQLEVLPSGGTDTARLQSAGGAAPVGAISVPTRYLHTPVESAHVDDVAAAIDLLVGFLETETGEHDYRL